MTRDELLDYCNNTYTMVTDRPFKRSPNNLALRHLNGKWFGLLSNVSADKLGLSGVEEVEILNLKINPELNALLQGQSGFLPGYHMSKTHWINVILAQFKEPSELADLIEESFMRTK